MVKKIEPRKMVSKMVQSLDLSYTSLGSLKDNIDEAIETYGKDSWLDTYNIPYDDSTYWGIYAKVPETDEEYLKRLKDEEAYKERQDARDKAEFERLQKKFGGKK